MADLDFFIIAILVLFIQYLAVYLFVRLGGKWQPRHPLSFYALAAVVGSIGFSLIFGFFKWYFNYTFVSLNFEFARNCMGFAMFLMIGKIYGLMPMEFLVRHLHR